MKKNVLACALLFAASQAFAMNGDPVNFGGSLYDIIDGITPEVYTDLPRCLEYQKKDECLSPGICKIFSSAAITGLQILANKAGYTFAAQFIPGTVGNVTEEWCKKPHCINFDHCIRWGYIH